MAEADFRLMTEATGQRIAAALEALHLATVTGVKGNAEQNYRHGDVSITPANIGAVAKSGDTMTGPLNIRNALVSHKIELIPPVGAGNGGYVDFAYSGEEIDNTSRIIEDQRGVLNVNGIPFDRANPVIGVPYGGTGATTILGALQNLFAPDAGAITEYPNEPGVYWTTSNIFGHMNPGNPYGVLVIFKAGYSMHVYLDAQFNLYYGFVGSGAGEPATWYVVNATAMSIPY